MDGGWEVNDSSIFTTPDYLEVERDGYPDAPDPNPGDVPANPSYAVIVGDSVRETGLTAGQAREKVLKLHADMRARITRYAESRHRTRSYREGRKQLEDEMQAEADRLNALFSDLPPVQVHHGLFRRHGRRYFSLDIVHGHMLAGTRRAEAEKQNRANYGDAIDALGLVVRPTLNVEYRGHNKSPTPWSSVVVDVCVDAGHPRTPTNGTTRDGLVVIDTCTREQLAGFVGCLPPQTVDDRAERHGAIWEMQAAAERAQQERLDDALAPVEEAARAVQQAWPAPQKHVTPGSGGAIPLPGADTRNSDYRELS